MRTGVLLFLLFLGMFLTGTLVLYILWWLLNRNQKEAPAALEISAAVPSREIELPGSEGDAAPERPDAGPDAGDGAVEPGPEAEVEEAPEPGQPDDLTRIEGIGPKIASVLQAAGVLTYAQLADTNVSGLEEILEAESPRLRRLADPSTWPEQAALASAGEWEALSALQGSLNRGRRAG